MAMRFVAVLEVEEGLGTFPVAEWLETCPVRPLHQKTQPTYKYGAEEYRRTIFFGRNTQDMLEWHNVDWNRNSAQLTSHISFRSNLVLATVWIQQG